MRIVLQKIIWINDNTKPFARMGRKAYRVSQRQPGCRNIIRYQHPFFICANRAKSSNKEKQEMKKHLLKKVVASLVCVAASAGFAVADVSVGVSTPNVRVRVGTPPPPPAPLPPPPPPRPHVIERERVIVRERPAPHPDRGLHRGHYKKHKKYKKHRRPPRHHEHRGPREY